MKLTESKLRSIIQEELQRLTESRLEGEDRERLAKAVEKAVDVLGRSLQRNTAGNRSSGEIEFVNRDDTRGFFVNGTRTRNRFDIQIAGRGRREEYEGTRVTLSAELGKGDVQKIVDAIEEEPLEAFRRGSMPGRGEAPRRDI